MRVLLVEDEPAAAHVLAKGLREQTYAVDVAGDGDAAVFQVGDHRLRRGDSRRDAARPGRLRRLPHDSRVGLRRADPHGDGARRGRGAHRRAGLRRRRLSGEAVRLRRAAGAAPGAGAARPAAAAAGAADDRAAHDRYAQPPGPGPQSRSPAHREGIRPARVSRPARRRRRQPRGHLRARVGRAARSGVERRRRLRAAAAPQARSIRARTR